MPGVLTPPTAPPICLSIPRNVMQNQYNFCSYLSQSHELWEQADLFVARGEGKGARGTCEGKLSLSCHTSCHSCLSARGTCEGEYSVNINSLAHQ